jgi:GDP-L-fucose synthase
VNISTGTATRIKDLAKMIKTFVGYEGEVLWDKSKPDGQMVKIFDTTRLSHLGLECRTSLEQGLRRTITWFTTHYNDGNVRL